MSKEIDKEKKRKLLCSAGLIIIAVLALSFAIFSLKNGAFGNNKSKSEDSTSDKYSTSDNYTAADNYTVADKHTAAEIPDYSGKAYIELNDNIPYFSKDDISKATFEKYSELDSLGRCGAAYAKLGRELMPTEKRGEIGQIRPSGWHTQKYNGVVEGNYLYNRCHLIAFSLAGENANDKNLITGTRFFNVNGMLPFETQIAEYIYSTGNHVMYRVSPIFEGNNLVAKGVQMEAYSVEDEGKGISFNVFVYNYQPGVDIDYATGESQLAKKEAAFNESYILNSSSKKIHLPTCDNAGKIKEKNKVYYEGSIDELIEQGYTPCGNCNPK